MRIKSDFLFSTVSGTNLAIPTGAHAADFNAMITLNETGAFLTKRACQEYISCYGYNHSRPHTYAMTAYRNYELARLLKILKTMEIREG